MPDKSPFRYQISEGDCVPTTVLNALAYLFQRKEIPGLVVQRVYQYTLDSSAGRAGPSTRTTGAACCFLAGWLDSYTDLQKARRFNVDAAHLTDADVRLGGKGGIAAWVKQGGVAALSVNDRKPQSPGSNPVRHYILAFRIEAGWVYCFDPYPVTRRTGTDSTYERLAPLGEHGANLRIRPSYLDVRSRQGKFQLGVITDRECILIRRSLP
jgi:hypothetical protein